MHEPEMGDEMSDGAMPPTPPAWGDLKDTGSTEARLAERVADGIRQTISRAVLAIALPALLAISGAGVATYVAVQVLGERADQAQREREALVTRLDDVEADVDRALDIRGELSAIKATMEAQFQSMNRRLDVAERQRSFP
jgi:type II secretory pathway component PulJ